VRRENKCPLWAISEHSRIDVRKQKDGRELISRNQIGLASIQFANLIMSMRVSIILPPITGVLTKL
jgi:hypothetical protein